MTTTPPRLGIFTNTGLQRAILPPNQASGKSYFLQRLLKEVVFSESGLAGTDLKWERRRGFLALGAYVAIGLKTMPVGMGEPEDADPAKVRSVSRGCGELRVDRLGCGANREQENIGKPGLCGHFRYIQGIAPGAKFCLR